MSVLSGTAGAASERVPAEEAGRKRTKRDPPFGRSSTTSVRPSARTVARAAVRVPSTAFHSSTTRPATGARNVIVPAPSPVTK